jgi:hypothetical protein
MNVNDHDSTLEPPPLRNKECKHRLFDTRDCRYRYCWVVSVATAPLALTTALSTKIKIIEFVIVPAPPLLLLTTPSSLILILLMLVSPKDIGTHSIRSFWSSNGPLFLAVLQMSIMILGRWSSSDTRYCTFARSTSPRMDTDSEHGYELSASQECVIHNLERLHPPATYVRLPSAQERSPSERDSQTSSNAIIN